MGVFLFITGVIFGIVSYIYIRKFLSENRIFYKNKKQYLVTFTLMYLSHPIDTSRKSEFIKTKPITIRVLANSEDDAESTAKLVIEDNIKFEIESTEPLNDNNNLST